MINWLIVIEYKFHNHGCFFMFPVLVSLCISHDQYSFNNDSCMLYDRIVKQPLQ